MTDNTQELREILEKEGWKYYDELNGFRKESQFTIPMFSTDQSKSYDSLSAGNYHELKDAIQAYTNAEIAKVLDRLETEMPSKRNTLVGDAYQRTFCNEYNKALKEVSKVIQAERTKLKEVK